MLQKNKTKDDVWVFHHYEEAEGRRVYRKQQIGTVREYPRRRDAEKAAQDLVTEINSQVRSPKTVRELATHYEQNELTPERKAFATRETHHVVLNHHILARWGDYKLTDVRTVQVEKWLDALPHAPATKTEDQVGLLGPFQPRRSPRVAGFQTHQQGPNIAEAVT